MNHVEGAVDAVHALRKLKKIYFITNNNTVPIDLFLQRNEPFKIVKEEVIRLVKILYFSSTYVIDIRCPTCMEKVNLQNRDINVSS